MFRKYLNKINKETSVLNTDSFDKRRFNQIYEMSKGLKQLEKGADIPMFRELLADIWASLYKMSPEIKDDDEIGRHLDSNKQLISNIMDEQSYQDFHETSKLDDMLSAIGTLRFGEETHQWLQEEQQRNEELNEQMQNLQDLMNEYNDDASPDNQNEQLEEEIEQALDDLSNEMENSLNQNGHLISQAVQQATEDSNETKENLESLFGGTEAGSNRGELQNMPLRDKISLAELLTNDGRMKEIAKWAGRYTAIARTKQKMKHKESTEQSGVEIGNDLERTLPNELLLLSDERTRNDFLRRYAEGQLMQYEQKGRESLGEGSIVVCLDQSGSMNELELQSKGFTLALMAIAKRQRRNFAYIPFDYEVGEIMQFPKGRINSNEMVKIAREFMAGGTNFENPLYEGLKIIQKDRFKDADIIFITDGEASISRAFLERFNSEKEDLKFNVLSLAIGRGVRMGALESFSDKVINISDFDDEGSFEAFEI